MQSNINKLNFIELLRFFASFSVLIWHYQHFSLASIDTSYNKNELPFTQLLRIFYEIGGSGVLVFWCISGYIFFYKYEELISKNKINFKKFFVNRFSRLYPLHFITLIIVLIFQEKYLNLFGNYFVYQINDLYHFLLQFFFISHWGFEKGYSFNGPIWSISIEIIVYIIFFLNLKIFGKSLIFNLIIISTCLLVKLLTDTNYLLFDCIIFFYGGGLAYISNNYLEKKNMIKYFHSKSYFFLVMLIPFICWYFRVYEIKYFYFIFFLSYSCAILLLSTIKFNLNIKYLKIIRILGNMTYGTYLIHFPFQLLVVIVFKNIGYDNLPIYENWFLLFYIFSVFLLAYFSFKFFETPTQQYIRKIYFKN
jgi:peptidoglycan/LPS O-acetylase OafA/YrhL